MALWVTCTGVHVRYLVDGVVLHTMCVSAGIVVRTYEVHCIAQFHVHNMVVVAGLEPASHDVTFTSVTSFTHHSHPLHVCALHWIIILIIIWQRNQLSYCLSQWRHKMAAGRMKGKPTGPGGKNTCTSVTITRGSHTQSASHQMAGHRPNMCDQEQVYSSVPAVKATLVWSSGLSSAQIGSNLRTVQEKAFVATVK